MVGQRVPSLHKLRAKYKRGKRGVISQPTQRASTHKTNGAFVGFGGLCATGCLPTACPSASVLVCCLCLKLLLVSVSRFLVSSPQPHCIFTLYSREMNALF
jgi:hypothetical protein